MIFSDLYKLQLLKEKNIQTVFERTLQITVNERIKLHWKIFLITIIKFQ